MPEQESGMSAIQEQWLLANVPFISLFCENDPFYTMRFLEVVGGRAFGYQLSDFIDNQRYFAASTIHPQDADAVDRLAEQVVAGATPAVARYRMAQADGSLVQVMTTAKSVLNAKGELQGIAGCTVDLSACPALQGDSGVLSDQRQPARRRPPVDRPAELTARWVAAQLPILTFFTENDAQYTVRQIGGSLEEMAGYSAEEFVNARKYKPSSTVLPEDQDIADAYLEAAASKEDERSVARLRLLDADGQEFPVLIFARGAKPPGSGAVGAAGGVLDIRHVPALQGKFGLLAP